MTKEEGLILSAYTGNLLVPDFADVHEFIEKLLGRPVWTHELRDPLLLKKVREKCKPLLPKAKEEPRWIPVTERLPDKEFWEYQKKYGQDNMEVLVMIKGAKVATTLYYDDEGDFSDDNGDTWLVTHWQPMPNPPKEEKE